MKRAADVNIVGAGILGLAHAYAAAKRGKSVTGIALPVALLSAISG